MGRVKGSEGVEGGFDQGPGHSPADGAVGALPLGHGYGVLALLLFGSGFGAGRA